MENATKALIIAASILIAIVLITLGVFVLGQGTTMVKENSDMTAEQVTAYNAKWEAFLGDKVSGSKVKQLIRTVTQHNRTYTEISKNSKQIILRNTKNFQEPSVDSINTGAIYKVKVAGTDNANEPAYTSAGLIKTILITEM